MEWKFNQKMKINKFLKMALFISATSLLFTACANKSPNKNIKKVEKPKIENINNVLNNAKVFEYDSRQKLYRNKFTQEQNRNELLLKFGNLCSNKKGKLVYVNHFINKSYVNSYTNNKAYICEVDNKPYFIAHIASQNINSYFSISVDEKVKKDYLDKQNDMQFESNLETTIDSTSGPKFESTAPSQESTEDGIKERQEIQKRERAREQKTKLLFNKKDQKTMTFFDSWKQTGKDPLCSTKCKSVNKRSTGYLTLKEATANNWQILSKVGEIKETIDETCSCTGYSLILKKLPSEIKISK
ncbi:MAG: hypothetical protein RBR65_07060 [Aliarcobacter sp.]|jgi:hypothetical protein|nr:hypothetical protein [Aliarcobacter sp.]